VQIEVLDETGRFRRRERLNEVLRRVVVGAGLATRVRGVEPEVTVVLVDDATIARRNAKDRGIDGPTDVLAYPLSEPDDVGLPAVPHLGDLWVSLETAERQARAGGRPTWHEVALLAAHGLLHLRGFDHQDEAGWRPFAAVQALAETEARAVDLARATRRLVREAANS